MSLERYCNYVPPHQYQNPIFLLSKHIEDGSQLQRVVIWSLTCHLSHTAIFSLLVTLKEAKAKVSVAATSHLHTQPRFFNVTSAPNQFKAGPLNLSDFTNICSLSNLTSCCWITDSDDKKTRTSSALDSQSIVILEYPGSIINAYCL